MKKNLFKYICAAIAIPFLAACSSLIDEPQSNVKVPGKASLTLDIDLPGTAPVTKSIANDPRNQSNTWSVWEKYVDGSLLYNVTLFVVNESGALVGYRQIHSGSSDLNSENGFYSGNSVSTTATNGTSLKITFPESSPLHGNVELLSAGNYTVIAVANHAPITVDSNTYPGLGLSAEDGSSNYNGNGDFNSIISSIISGFQANSGVAGFNKANYPSFFNYRLNAGDDRVCKLVPQPLVMIRNITLSEGNNNLSGELSRTFARVRLEVNNKSTDTFLDVSSLSFNGSYASKNAYLFNDVEAAGANIHSHFSLYEGNPNSEDNTRGMLDVNSSDAIITASTASHRILASSTDPIFDAYILEGKVESSAEFTFTFNASYKATMEDGDATHNVMIGSFLSNYKYGTGTSGGGMFWNPSYGIIDDAFYLFIRGQVGNNSQYCYKVDEQNNKIVVSNANAGNEDSGSFKMSPEYIWKIELTGNPTTHSTYVESVYGNLRSVSTNLYLQPYTGGDDMSLKLGSQPVSGNQLLFKMNFGNEDEAGTIFCQYNGEYYYINSSATEAKWTRGGNLSRYQYLTFETIIAEPTTPVQKDITYNFMETENGGTSVRKDQIVRNDFYHGIIPISVGE